ncbi:MAG TPA: XRE family transcriptional regulator [Acidobacteriaceae bacterium]|jgi:transcriptional regulator with XRE-family HTH domain|nr:XRE family transcriptional regulator [Acidobacteriaceae bacterium]
MDLLNTIRERVIYRRKGLHLRQSDLAQMAQLSLPTVKSFEQGRMGELGFSKVVRLLAALGMELRIQEINQGRPTLDQLREEAEDD